MKHGILAVSIVFFTLAHLAHAQAEGQGAAFPVFPPNLTVTGKAEVSVKPDRAVVRLGAIAQAEDAQAAQQQVSDIVSKMLEAVKALGINDANITTSGLSLYPVYSEPGRPRQDGGNVEPQIVGYRASNTVAVQVDNLEQVGAVIDASIGSGANQLESLTFELKNDTRAREQALQEAAQQAKSKAQTISHAMGVQLGQILEIQEGGVHLAPPQPFMGRAAVAMAEQATPIEPGQIRVEATVTLRYGIRQN